MKEKVLKEIQKELKENWEFPNWEKVDYQTNIQNDLGLDSLEVVELTMDLEETFSVDLSSNEENPKTVGELCDIVCKAAERNCKNPKISKEEIAKAMSSIETKVKHFAQGSHEKLIITVYKQENSLHVKQLL